MGFGILFGMARLELFQRVLLFEVVMIGLHEMHPQISELGIATTSREPYP